MMVNPEKPGSIIDIPLNTGDKTVECSIEAKILITNSTHAEDLLTVTKLITFKLFGTLKGVPLTEAVKPHSVVTFEIPERPNRIQLWAEQVFNLDTKNNSFENSPTDVRLAFIDVKTNAPLYIEANTTPQGLLVKIHTDSIKPVSYTHLTLPTILLV